MFLRNFLTERFQENIVRETGALKAAGVRHLQILLLLFYYYLILFIPEFQILPFKPGNPTFRKFPM